MDGVILGTVVDVRHLADVKLLLLLVVERLQQLAPPAGSNTAPDAITALTAGMT